MSSSPPRARRCCARWRRGWTASTPACGRSARRAAGAWSASRTFASFASLWLLPRIEAFQRAHPDIDIRVGAHDALHRARRRATSTSRCATAGPSRRSAAAVRLFGEQITPVVSPWLLEHAQKSGAPLNKPADLAHHTLLEEDDALPSAEYLSWRHWLAVHGLPELQPRALALPQLHLPAGAGRARRPGRGPGAARAGGRIAGARRADRALRRHAPRQPFAYWLRHGAAGRAARAGALRRMGAGAGARRRAWRSAKAPTRRSRSARRATPSSVTISMSAMSCARGASSASSISLRRPGDADRGDLRMRRQPAVEIAAAVAEPIAARREADAGREHHVGHDLARRRWPGCRIRRRSPARAPSQRRKCISRGSRRQYGSASGQAGARPEPTFARSSASRCVKFAAHRANRRRGDRARAASAAPPDGAPAPRSPAATRGP